MRILFRNALCRPSIGGEVFAERVADALAGCGYAAALVAMHHSAAGLERAPRAHPAERRSASSPEPATIDQRQP